MDDVILSIRGLSKSFELRERNHHFTAFEELEFEVRSGSITALSGPSGSGKSSVLRCIYRTYLPGRGGMYYTTRDGEQLDLSTVPEHRMLELRRNEISFVTQFLHCLPRKSAVDVIARAGVQAGRSRREAVEHASELLRDLGISERLWSMPPATFSGGEKQRVNIARGFVSRPRLLLLDEPTASLDSESAERVLALVANARRGGTGVLAVLHDQALIERVADNIVSLAAPTPVA